MSYPTRRLRAIVERGGVSASYPYGDPPHMGASLTSRELGSWQPAQGSADADLLPDLPVLMARSRDLFRNHGIAAGANQTLVDNVVGTGPRLSSTPDYLALGKSKDWAEEWSNRVERLVWRPWANTTACDAAYSLTFGGMTQQVFRSALQNGEALALPLWIPDARSTFGTRIQVIESDRLGNPLGRVDTKHLRSGIEIDDYGRPLAYWIRKGHPGDAYIGYIADAMQWEQISAETSWGRKRVIHVHEKERTGQSRGKPILAPVLQQFKMLDHYQRTELQAAIVNALVAMTIETPLDSQTVAQMFGGDLEDPRFQAYLAAKNEYRVALKGGAVLPLFPGDKAQPFTPARPASQYGAFVEVVLRHIGAALGLPYELLLKDFSKTNYSSARAALLEAWRFFNGRRHWLTTYWCTPVYELVLEEAVNAGIIEAPGFYENRYAYSKCLWVGDGRGWIDPVKEAQAAKIRMDNNLSTLERECAEQGLDWEEVLEQRAAEIARIRELGLPEAAPITLRPDQTENNDERQAA